MPKHKTVRYDYGTHVEFITTWSEPPFPRDGWLYILYDPSTDYIKFGFSFQNPGARARAQMIGSNRRQIATLPTTTAFDKEMRKILAPYKVPRTNDWFHCNDHVRSFINRLFEIHKVTEPITFGHTWKK